MTKNLSQKPSRMQMPRGIEKTKRKTRTRHIPAKFADYDINMDSISSQHLRLLKHHADGHYTLRFFPKKAPTAPRSSAKNAEIRKTMKSLGITELRAANYLPSPFDRPELVSVKPVHLLKATGGCGLFANVRIEAGTCIGSYTGLEFTQAEYEAYLKRQHERDTSYAMNVAGRIIDGKSASNFTRYINFSDTQANVEFKESQVDGKKIMRLRTTKPILPGQQFLVDYNVYDEHAAKQYYFLNPQDNSQSTNELYMLHAMRYQLVRNNKNLSCFGLNAGDYCYITSIGNSIFANRNIEEISPILDAEVNLPFLKINTQQLILDATQTDLITPIMLASFFGQPQNVAWLIAHGANVDQQQNHSGNSPLFFALEGYRQARGSKANYLAVICLLLNNEANALIHDREESTFIHKAVTVLSAQDLDVVLKTLLTKMSSNFRELYNYLDERNDDIVIRCIRNKQFEQLALLLHIYPTYFDEAFDDGAIYQREINREKFRESLHDYSNEEIDVLLMQLRKCGVKISSSMKYEVSLVEDSRPGVAPRC